MTVTAADIMTRDLVTVGWDDSVEMAQALFDDHGFHHLPVVDGHGALSGVLSDGDVLRALSPFVKTPAERDRDRYTLRRPVHQIMSRHPVSVAGAVSVRECARRLVETRYGCLPVVDDGRMRGLVTRHDVLSAVVAGRT